MRAQVTYAYHVNTPTLRQAYTSTYDCVHNVCVSMCVCSPRMRSEEAAREICPRTQLRRPGVRSPAKYPPAPPLGIIEYRRLTEIYFDDLCSYFDYERVCLFGKAM